MRRAAVPLGDHRTSLRSAFSIFGDDVLQLVLASKYIGRHMVNVEVSDYLEARHLDISGEFRNIVAATLLETS